MRNRQSCDSVRVRVRQTQELLIVAMIVTSFVGRDCTRPGGRVEYIRRAALARARPLMKRFMLRVSYVAGAIVSPGEFHQ